MNARELKARQIVAGGNITVGVGCYLVGSQTGQGRYRVVVEGLFPSCNCPDWEATGADCKHMLAVREWLLIQAGDSVIPSRRKAANPVRRPTYKQDWNRAMKNEVLAKLVCHNICCAITAMYERGIDPAFFGVGEGPGDGPRDVLRFPAGGSAAHKINGLHN